MSTPSEPIRMHVEFLFNNIIGVDLYFEANEIIARVNREFWPWMARYFVMLHASTKPSLHTYYSEFFDVLNASELNETVLRETLFHIKMLLRSVANQPNQLDFDMLKNLGNWLGEFTLARNRPIQEHHLDLNRLLSEAYTKGQLELQCVVPFVVRIMTSCTKNQAFQPPNRWTVSIMGILSEVYNEPNTSLNLRVEIELLSWKLGTNIAEFTPSTFLKEERKKGIKDYLLCQ